MVSTNISKNWWLYRFLFFLARPFTKSLQQAACTSVYCATAPELTGVTGVYFNNCFPCQESEKARNDDMAKLLWNVSIDMVLGVLRPNAPDLAKYKIQLDPAFESKEEFTLTLESDKPPEKL